MIDLVRAKARSLGATIRNRLRYPWAVITRDVTTINRYRWSALPDHASLVYDFELTSSSRVFDIGGHLGDWTAGIIDRYGCEVFVFEPLPTYEAHLRDRFAGLGNVHVFPFGLADRDQSVEMAVCGDGSSAFRRGTEVVAVRLRDIVAFVGEQGLSTLDLVKINIEGGEFALLRRMCDGGLTERCRSILVQFHAFYPNAASLRRDLRRELAHTHTLRFDVPYIWECWDLRAVAPTSSSS